MSRTWQYPSNSSTLTASTSNIHHQRALLKYMRMSQSYWILSADYPFFPATLLKCLYIVLKGR
jgi:hypothetical protein